MKRIIIIALATSALAACGGPQKTSKKAMTDMAKDAPPPPKAAPGKKVERTVSREAKKDFAEAYAFYKEQEAAGWNEERCTAAARKFEDVASSHSKLVEAHFNAGLAYHNCGMLKDAEARYQAALKINPAHAPSMSALGEIYYRGGNDSMAEKYWDQAVKADQKTIAARNNLAWIYLQRMRKTSDRGQWSKYETEARGHLSRVLAVDTDNVEAYVIYALVFMEGSERNKNRLDLAKLLLDEGAKRDPKFAPLWNAYGLLDLKKDNVGRALSNFQRAVELDPRFVEARMNVGNIVLGFRKYDEAKVQFEAVLELQPKNYDALIGLGYAQRGLGDLEAAEATYEKARELDGKRGEAFFNLGLLYKDFRAARGADEKEIVGHYKKARTYFQQYMGKGELDKSARKEAEDHIDDCDKYIKQLEEVIRTKDQPEPSASN